MSWIFRAMTEGVGVGVIAAFFIFDLDFFDVSSLLGVALCLVSVLMVVHGVATAIYGRPKRCAWFEL